MKNYFDSPFKGKTLAEQVTNPKFRLAVSVIIPVTITVIHLTNVPVIYHLI
ncbi:cat encodes chloramphenicol acetyltransferase [Xenorhabdus thuongxuanensis]|uniref:Cat encodes chloramphenicol acetyltransferase n=1 Tax=Xenorhabdus thuongxuanensis TaxID=1873484 RepID=A0A1Q5TW67_9GAMM|nr:cat encodes chloramphenicol acetyltransferase [Xenorhabdus thuongxuanensis]